MTDDSITFREYIESIIKSLDDKLISQWSAHDKVHNHLDESRKLAVTEINRRLDEMNNFREQVTDERANFVDKETYQVKMDDLIRRMDKFENWRSNLEGKMWMLGAVITGLTVIINLVIKLLFK